MIKMEIAGLKAVPPEGIGYPLEYISVWASY